MRFIPVSLRRGSKRTALAMVGAIVLVGASLVVATDAGAAVKYSSTPSSCSVKGKTYNDLGSPDQRIDVKKKGSSKSYGQIRVFKVSNSPLRYCAALAVTSESQSASLAIVSTADGGGNMARAEAGAKKSTKMIGVAPSEGAVFSATVHLKAGVAQVVKAKPTGAAAEDIPVPSPSSGSGSGSTGSGMKCNQYRAGSGGSYAIGCIKNGKWYDVCVYYGDGQKTRRCYPGLFNEKNFKDTTIKPENPRQADGPTNTKAPANPRQADGGNV